MILIPNHHKQKRIAVTVFALCVTVLVMLSITPAFADEVTETQIQINTIYRLIRNFSIPVGAVGLAICGFMFFFGDERVSEQAVKRIKHLFVASLCVFLLGSAMHGAIVFVENNGLVWLPGTDHSEMLGGTGAELPEHMGESNIKMSGDALLSDQGSSSSGAYPSGGNIRNPTSLTYRSGSVAQAQFTMEVPESLEQRGLSDDVTWYTDFYGYWSRGSRQEEVAKAWNDTGRGEVDAIAAIEGKYLIAMKDRDEARNIGFGKAGDLIQVFFKDGSSIIAILGDEKGSNANDWGHEHSEGTSLVEWEALDSSAWDKLKTRGLWGLEVSQVINYGSWLDN